MVNFGHGGGQVLMGGEMDLEGLDGGVSPPIPPILGNPDFLSEVTLKGRDHMA